MPVSTPIQSGNQKVWEAIPKREGEVLCGAFEKGQEGGKATKEKGGAGRKKDGRKNY